jgi:hypothetical protein
MLATIFIDEKYHWPDGGLMSNRYDNFVGLIKSNPKDEQKVNTQKKNS